eukprot:CAMPEP_0172065198 /NCGR_PEP_ID=MMETSP1043-20130122/10511_1 /TAXON_ID=464988 /ORGANISM="Hemiselmis andersenii, Strain CCMP441" /LENGTH=245 /DNA_ID=CAMNT_0012725297 /DNA_START=207 /DNA_END=941 /DNA_ORIENTATION=+
MMTISAAPSLHPGEPTLGAAGTGREGKLLPSLEEVKKACLSPYAPPTCIPGLLPRANSQPHHHSPAPAPEPHLSVSARPSTAAHLRGQLQAINFSCIPPFELPPSTSSASSAPTRPASYESVLSTVAPLSSHPSTQPSTPRSSLPLSLGSVNLFTPNSLGSLAGCSPHALRAALKAQTSPLSNPHFPSAFPRQMAMPGALSFSPCPSSPTSCPNSPQAPSRNPSPSASASTPPNPSLSSSPQQRN